MLRLDCYDRFRISIGLQQPYAFLAPVMYCYSSARRRCWGKVDLSIERQEFYIPIRGCFSCLKVAMEENDVTQDQSRVDMQQPNSELFEEYNQVDPNICHDLSTPRPCMSY